MRQTRLVHSISQDIKSPDQRRAKTAIQAACNLIENRGIRESNRLTLARSLSLQLTSHDVLVRRWTYKLIALLGFTDYLPHLIHQLSDDERDAENRCWAIASVASLHEDYRQVLSALDDDLTVAYQLSAHLFAPSPSPIDRLIREAENSDDSLSHLWLALLYGDRRIDLPAGLVRELSRSRDPEVVEYTIWSLARRNEAGLELISIDPHLVAQQPESVRRWYYQLLGSSKSGLDTYAELVNEWIATDLESKAREGLAKAVASAQSRHWRTLRRDWLRSETDPYVLSALQSTSLRTFSPRIPSPHSIDLKSVYTKSAARSTSTTSVPRPIYSVLGGITIVNDKSVRIGSISGNVGQIQGAGSVSRGDIRFQVEQRMQALHELRQLEHILQECLRQEEAGLLRHVQEAIQEGEAESPEAPSGFWARVRQVIMTGTALTGLAEGATKAIEALTHIAQ